MSLLPNNIHKSWNNFLTEDILAELKEIENKIGDDFNPKPKENVLRFLSLDLKAINCIWLGLDPYTVPDINPDNGHSLVPTGRSFEVGTLKSWNDKFRQVSLKNIVRLIYKNYNNIEDYKDIKKFSEIQKEIQNNQFNILPPNEIFNSWESQGVLCLNAYPTCEVGKTGSHKNIWKEFSVKLLNYISLTNPNITWFLWGNEAISHKEYIKEGIIYESRHPMMCSEKYPDDFLKSDCFKNTMDKINWLGI